LREVSDERVEYCKRQEFRVQQEALTKPWQDAIRLSRRRYESGVTSFLEVLDTARQLFGAELDLAQAQLAERLAVVQLYKAVGGGWQLESPRSPTTKDMRGKNDVHRLYTSGAKPVISQASDMTGRG
jgi:outer membrane protein TolC